MGVGRNQWVLAGLAVGVMAAPVAGMSVELMGDLPGGTHYSEGVSVSADGRIVGGVSYGTGTQMIRWTRTGGMEELYTTNFFPAYSSVAAMSADGSTLVGYKDVNADLRATVWTAGGGLQYVSDVTSQAADVSADGSIVVGSYIPVRNKPSRAFRWTAATGAVELPLSLGPNDGSDATACSADGSVIVGTIGYGSPGGFVYRWSASEGFTLLPAVLGSATSVSADGTFVAGFALGGPSVDGRSAYRWSSATGMQFLGSVPGQDSDTVAVAMSADGSVVVGRSGVMGNSDGWVWTERDGMRSLRQILEAGGIDTSGWEELVIDDVSADGSTVVGWAKMPALGSGEGFVAFIPEPTCPALCSLVVVSAMRRRRWS